MKRSIFHRAGLASLLIAAVVPGTASAQGLVNAPGGNREFVPGQVIVKFRPVHSAAHAAQNPVRDTELGQLQRVTREQLLRRGMTPIRQVPELGLALASTPAGLSVEQTVQQLRKDPNVLYVTANAIVSTCGPTPPNDPLFSYSWNLQNTGQAFAYFDPTVKGTPGADVSALNAWALFTGSRSVVVADLDTGIDYTHPDLIPNIWTNPGETGPDADGNDRSSNGHDDDGDGVVDDVHGAAFTDGVDTPSGDPFDSDFGHGTHTAGTIGAAGNNGIGSSGINWNVTILPVRCFTNGYSTNFNIIRGIQYITNLKKLWQSSHGTLGADVAFVNDSWGGGVFDPALYDAFKAAGDAGIIHVCAAGNSSTDNDTNPFFPSGFTTVEAGPLWNVISVAATDWNDDRSSFSNFGRHSVTLGAPGSSVLSTIPLWLADYYKLPFPYDYWSGTSMATPHVTGALALLKGYTDSIGAPLTPQEMIDRLKKTGDPIGAMWHKTSTGRRLNLYNLLADIEPPAPAETAFQVSITTDKSHYLPGQRANITVSAARNGIKLPGVVIQIRIVGPGGFALGGAHATNSKGQASFVLFTPKSGGIGAYTVTVSDSFYKPYVAQMPETATATFSVP